MRSITELERLGVQAHLLVQRLETARQAKGMEQQVRAGPVVQRLFLDKLVHFL
jgi:hypothetical protein